jgi:hypothetical protein
MTANWKLCQQRRRAEAKAAKQGQPSPAPKAVPATVAIFTADVVAIVRRLAKHGLADLLDVRRAMGGTRQQQDEAINNARRAGLVSACNRECRERPTPEQIASNLEGTLGFLMLCDFSS